ncbi:MAG: hypothetical protein HOD58_12820 [Gammaproteobacteria bacterium]|jgi:hypothetical protein|nr:hypothetical protein [Candidatus Neomarinimicrobiota bacterium]MBT4330797.1 hypothetical protein [Gammaproteobacteria bacterium]
MIISYPSSRDFIDNSPDPKQTEKWFRAAREWMPVPMDCSGIFYIADKLLQLRPKIEFLDPNTHQQLNSLYDWAMQMKALSSVHPWKEDQRLFEAKPPLGTLNREYFDQNQVPLWSVLVVDDSGIGQRDQFRFYRNVLVHYLITFAQVKRFSVKLDPAFKTNLLISRSTGLLQILPHPEHQNRLGRGKQEVTVKMLQRWLEWLCRKSDYDPVNWCGYVLLLFEIETALSEGNTPPFFQRPSDHTREHLWESPWWISGDALSLNLDTDPFDQGEEFLLAELKQGVGAKFSQKLYQAGVSPEEFVQTVEHWVSFEGLGYSDVQSSPVILKSILSSEESSSNTQLYTQNSIATSYVRARGWARHRLLDKQLFTTRLSRPPAPVLGLLFGAMDARYLGGDKSICETLHLLAIAIVTGASPEEIVQLPRLQEVDQGLKQHGSIGYVPSEKIWVRRVKVPKYRSVTPYLLIHDFFGLGKLLDQTADTWFMRTVDEHQLTYQGEIIPWLKKEGVPEKWLRFDRLPTLLREYLIGREESNQLLVETLFGSQTESDMGGVYTAFEQSELNHFLEEELSGLYRILVRNGYKAHNHGLFHWNLNHNPRLLSAAYVGSDRTPELSQVKQLVELLQKKLGGYERARSLHNQIDYHNLFTTYTTLILSVVSGFRNVKTPILNLMMIDPDTGLMQLQEKDRKDNAHARVVYLPASVRSLIKHYLNHLRTLLLNLPYEYSGVIEVPITKQRDRAIRQQLNFDGSDYSLYLNRNLFYLEFSKQRYQFTEVIGSHLGTRLNYLITGVWPADNAGRHFVRSYLQNRGCASTVIYAFMGHWSEGEEYWGPHSALDPWHYRNAISLYLDRLLNDIGFDPDKASLS